MTTVFDVPAELLINTVADEFKDNNEINIYCGECGHTMKIPYIREKKLKRRAKIDSYTFKKRDYE